MVSYLTVRITLYGQLSDAGNRTAWSVNLIVVIKLYGQLSDCANHIAWSVI